MTELEKLNIEEQIWRILKGYESVFDKYQPVFSFDIENKRFLMSNALLNELPSEARIKLLEIVKKY